MKWSRGEEETNESRKKNDYRHKVLKKIREDEMQCTNENSGF